MPAGRPKTPTSILEARGAFKKNPQRARERQGEPKPAYGLGDPPAHFLSTTSPSAAQSLAIWNEISGRMPWLTIADWIAVELAVELTVKLRRHTIKSGEYSTLLKVISELGGTGTGRAGRKGPDAEESPGAWAELARGAKAI